MDLQKYDPPEDRVIMKSRWTDEGYVQKIFHKSEKKEVELTIPFEDMKEVLIGYSLLVLPNPDRQRSSVDIYRIAAKIVIKYQVNDQSEDYLLFLSETQKDLATWLQRIKEMNASVYVTKWDLYQVPAEDYRSHYESIIKEPFTDEAQLPNVLDTTKDHQEHPVWRPPSFYQRREHKQTIWDERIKKLTLFVFLSNFFVSLLWMPFWRLDDEGTFSNGMFLYFAAILMIYIFGSYVRKKQPVYQSLFDTILLSGAWFGGLLGAKLYTSVPNEMFYALYVNVITFSIFLNGIFFIGRIPVTKKNKRSVTH
ncbi:hypothetical protein NQ095_10820 [Rossellomorea sp. SC111]|uniref:hypothetical protein n=1 Tax=Rossellomorea sp. SC111 TaxID=2968985 RepID=UPI00215A5A03|nr:hypothetical protein [Rossellomorea sp. SC111]MCR8848900.1 hypothetical protein [Rossellomorea sp. SC111]